MDWLEFDILEICINFLIKSERIVLHEMKNKSIVV